ncbi:MAG: hypothetical protein ABIN80_28195 [Dyadobacter sp.]|uniref:hypothetical protein n=1 Tax=Dyadobacter sp. TaxID=1914288 RepID=UPI003265CA91
MTRFLLVFWVFVGCQKDIPEPDARLKPLKGVWKLSQIKVQDGTSQVWQDVPYFSQNDIEFRADGVILDYKKEEICCNPSSLVVNGVIIEIKKSFIVPKNNNCAAACNRCQTWLITYTDGELILTGCLATDVKKYKR